MCFFHVFAIFSMFLLIFFDARSDVNLVGWSVATFHQAFATPKGTI